MTIKGDQKEILVFAEQRDGEIHSVSYELLGKAAELAERLDATLSSVLLGPPGIDAEELIYRGADRVYLYEDAAFEDPKESLFRENLVSLVDEVSPEVFLIGATNFGRSLAPRVAASLETGLTADCTGLEIDEDGKLIQIRPAFTGNVLAHIKTSTLPQMSTVRYKEFEEADRDTAREGEVVEREPDVDISTDAKILERMKEEEVKLEEAQVIVSGGRGLKDPKDFELFRELADELEGEIGASRPLVDEGWIGRAHQVGYSGKRVKPIVYFAFGISGASQHLAGMKESDTIIAVNSDPSAPIFEVADYGIVGDLYEVVPQLIDQVKNGG